MFRRQLIGAVLGVAALAFSMTNAFAADPWGEEPFPVKGKVTVVDFGAEWCADCPEMVKIFNELQEEYGDKAAFVVIDIDKYQGIEDKYLIEQMPSQMFFDAAGEPIWIHRGALDKDQLRERVEILRAGPSQSSDNADEPKK